MFAELKKRDVLIRKFHDGAAYLSRLLNTKGHGPFVDSEIERFEREVVGPLDKEFANAK